MKHTHFLYVLASIICLDLQAQEATSIINMSGQNVKVLTARESNRPVNDTKFKINKSTGTIKIDLNSAIIEGYSGNEIEISYAPRVEDTTKRAHGDVAGFEVARAYQTVSQSYSYGNSWSDQSENDKTKGLRVITASGAEDNTGLGIYTSEEAGMVSIKQIAKTTNRKILVKVPKAMNIKFSCDNMYNVGNILLSNISSEIEVSAQYNKIKLHNVSGPMTIKTIHGGVEGELSNAAKGPISIISAYQDIDLKVPTNLNANMSLYAPYGEVFADPSISIKIDANPNAEASYKNEILKGKLGAGGPEVSIKANYGKIYLRRL